MPLHLRSILLVALVAAGLAGCAANATTSPARGLVIVDRPIPFSPSRIAITRDYIRTHYGLAVEDIRIVPRIIVLHWTAAPTLEGSFSAFAPEMLPGSRTDLAGAGQVNVSAHFLVDRDGTVYRLMPETWMARHVIGLNYEAIGIENVGGAGGVEDLTPAQVEANVQLIRSLTREYRTLQYLIGHSEYREFEGHPLWRELDAAYRTQKIDPGPRFLAAVRRGVAPLGLKGPAEIARERRVGELSLFGGDDGSHGERRVATEDRGGVSLQAWFASEIAGAPAPSIGRPAVDPYMQAKYMSIRPLSGSPEQPSPLQPGRFACVFASTSCRPSFPPRSASFFPVVTPRQALRPSPQVRASAWGTARSHGRT